MENKEIKILAIDDNRDNLITLKAIIYEVLPQSVVYAELSGQSGIASARKNDPDVILLDIVMPGLDGYEVCKIIKADEQLSETPIIFLTALKGDKQSRILALEAGGEAFLAKPVDSTELKAQILAMLKIKEAATNKKDKRQQLEELVQKRTEELKSANIAALNLLEDLNNENEIRRQREIELKMSKDLLSQTEIIGKVGGWSFNIDTMEQKWTDEVYRIHEVEISPVPSVHTGINYYTRESRPIIDKAVQRAIEHGEDYDLELEIITAKGNMRAVHTVGKADLKNRRIYGFFQDITERKQAEEKRKELLKQLELISFHLPGVIYQFKLRPDGSFHFPYASPGIYNIYGVQPKDVEHDATIAFKAIHPDDLEQVSVSINHSAQNLTPWHDIYRTNQPSGKTIWVEGNSTPQKMEDGSIIWHGFIQDITVRKQAEEKLKLLNRAVEASSVSVVITDAEGQINYINPYFTKLTGYSYEEARGQNPRVLKSGNQPITFYEELWNTILSGSEWTGEFNNKKKNGELFWEKAIISPIQNSEGKVTNFVAIKEDITERKKMLEELVAAKEHAEESDRLKSAFLANMSHEIRTPMNGILGFSELLKEPGLTGEQQQEYIRIIEKSGVRMLNIINQIVDISKIEAGLMTLDIKESNINEQIEYIYTFFKPEAETKGIRLSFRNTLPAKEAIIQTDREKLYAILTNLIKNAIKYTMVGFIEFGYKIVETQCIASLQFYVKDSGIGVPKDRQEAIFERFIQADIEDRMAYQGAGLGLAITKAYVEMLGGKIGVESEEGIGSTFYFTLPYNTEPLKETTDRQPEPSGKNEIVRKLKILIAEDDEVSEMLIDNYIKIFGKEILKARTGIEAVEVCRNNPDTDLILMDIRMPDMGGYEATRQIRQFNREVVIIAQTAHGLTGDREKAIEAGCNDYISKPISKDKLQSLIQKYLNNNVLTVN